MKEISDGIVFSNDINRILNGYNALDFNYKDIGLIVPNKDFIEYLRKDFLKCTKNIFDEVTIVEEEDLLDIASKLENIYFNKLPIVSLDKIYFDKDKIIFLDCTRLDGTNLVVSRNNSNDLSDVNKQIKYISNVLKSIGQNKILLADDVVYSGNVLKRIIEMFKKYDIEVIGILGLIISSESYNYFKELELGIMGGYIMSDSVIDQICERDFYFGIPCSGISILKNNEIYKAPYFKPFGNPVERASIPEYFEEDFSKSCIKRSTLLWEEIERLSKRNVYTSELPERINNLSSGNVVKVLRKELNNYDTNRNNG